MPEIFLILTLCAVGAGFIYWVYLRYIRKVEEVTKITPERDQKILNDIIEAIFYKASALGGKDISKNKVSKVHLMEKLNLRPRQLKEYLSKLQDKDIASEGEETVNITKFGAEFFKNFKKDGKWRL